MKFVWATIALSLLFVVRGTAQEKIIEPEEFSVFYFLSTSGQLVTLERVTPTPVSRTPVTLPGDESSVRFPVGIDMQFIVRVTEDFARAKATMQFLRFEAQNGTRRMKSSLRINVEKYGNSSLRLVPHDKLMPGEYCLSRTTIAQGFCFGIDPAQKP